METQSQRFVAIGTCHFLDSALAPTQRPCVLGLGRMTIHEHFLDFIQRPFVTQLCSYDPVLQSKVEVSGIIFLPTKIESCATWPRIAAAS